jgi:hypothetical protein
MYKIQNGIFLIFTYLTMREEFAVGAISGFPTFFISTDVPPT